MRPGKGQVSLLCLPEMCIPGYGCEDAFYSHGTFAQSNRMLAEILPHTKGMIVSLGLPVKYLNRIYNAACLVADGKIMGFTAKKYLAGDGIHYEPRWFNPWPQGEVAELPLNGETYPLGDLYYEVDGIRIGFEICEDAWVANRPGSSLFRRGVDIILNPSASHFAFNKMEIRKRFVLEGFPGLRRELHLRQPAGQRGRPRHLRRQRPDCFRRENAGHRPAVLLRRPPPGNGRD
jgi:NAD+ synthase (glutamine-hydrolysing)